MATLELDNVTKQYRDDGTITAVEDLSISVADGEFLVLVGPSGCGKSTTLRMIAGLEPVTAGEIRIGDDIVTDHSPQQRDLAMVFQSYALYPHMTVSENIGFGLEESTDMTDAEIETQVTETAEMLDISDLLSRLPGDISGGQQQRVALGRAIVRDPRVFLMDEPLSNLDAKLRSEMRIELQHLQENLNVTTIYVTHDQTEAMTMADRIAVLNDGKLQQVGTPLECYHQPNNLFVAEFIGEPTINTFKIERAADRMIGSHFEYPLIDLETESSGSDAFILGIRPGDVEVTDAVSRDTEFQAVVDVIEPRGNQNTVHLHFDPENPDSKFIVTVDGLQTLKPDDEVAVNLPKEAIQLFDVESGTAVRNRSIETIDALSSEVPPA